MNTNDELKQLELATSSAPEQGFDADAGALREGWGVLSSALDKCSGHFDEAALLGKLQREIAAAPPLAETSRRSEGWIAVAALLGGALAASLLLIVAHTGGWLDQQPIAKPTKAVTPHNNLAATPRMKPAPGVETPFHGINKNDGSNWTWDDSLDSQISLAAAQMQTFQNPALPLDASISTLTYQLQQMAQDLDEGAL